MSQCGWCQTVIDRATVPENGNGCIRLTCTHTCTPNANAEKHTPNMEYIAFFILFPQCECLFADIMQKDAPHKQTYEHGYHQTSFSLTLLQDHCRRSNCKSSVIVWVIWLRYWKKPLCCIIRCSEEVIGCRLPSLAEHPGHWRLLKHEHYLLRIFHLINISN